MRKFAVIAVMVLFYTALFVGVYTIRNAQLDDYVESLEVPEEQEQSSERGITSVKVGMANKTYTLEEICELDVVPVVVDAIILYDDGELVCKQAYISYSDDGEARYIDGDYGRFLLPIKGD